MMARNINAVHGAPVIAAWQVDDLPDDWLDTMIAIATDMPRLNAGLAKLEAHKQAWRNSHPTYRKHTH